MTTKTDDEKIQELIIFLTETHLDTQGGYPYDHEILDDKYLIVAALNYGDKTEVNVYRIDKLVGWWDASLAMAEAHGDDEPADYFWETKEDFSGQVL